MQQRLHVCNRSQQLWFPALCTAWLQPPEQQSEQWGPTLEKRERLQSKFIHVFYTTWKHKLIREVTCIWFQHCNKTLKRELLLSFTFLKCFRISIRWHAAGTRMWLCSFAVFKLVVPWWGGVNRHSTGNCNITTTYTNSNLTNKRCVTEDSVVYRLELDPHPGISDEGITSLTGQ